MTKNYTIRLAKISETKKLSDLALRSKSIWEYDPNFIKSCKSLLTLSQKDIYETIIYVIIYNDITAGFYQLIPIDNKSVDLGMFFIEPKMVKKQLGSILFEHCKEITKSFGYKTLNIESDPNAEGFYRKMGAKPIGYSISLINPNRKLPLLELSLN